MFGEEFIKNLSEKGAGGADRDSQSERVTNKDDLTYYIYLGLLAKKAKDTTDDKLYQAAELKASTALTKPFNGLKVCNKCHTPKECIVKFKDKLMLVNCMCRCEIEAEANWQKTIRERERRERRETFLKENTRNSDYKDCTFENDEFSNSELTRFAKRYCEEFQKHKDETSGILFYGSPGTGKTFTAGCIVNELISRGFLGCMISVHDMLNTMWDSGSKDEYLQRLKRFDIVMIDDLGAEHQSKSGYELDQLCSAIDTIDRANKRLIVTTNLKLEDFTTPKNLQEARVYDRLLTLCQYHVKAEGESRRRKEVRENFSKYDSKIKEWMQ